MAKSTVEKLNELKEKELENRENRSIEQEEGDKSNDNPSAVIDGIDTFTELPSQRTRKHTDPIDLDKEPGV